MCLMAFVKEKTPLILSNWGILGRYLTNMEKARKRIVYRDRILLDTSHIFSRDLRFQMRIEG